MDDFGVTTDYLCREVSCARRIYHNNTNNIRLIKASAGSRRFRWLYYYSTQIVRSAPELNRFNDILPAQSEFRNNGLKGILI